MLWLALHFPNLHLNSLVCTASAIDEHPVCEPGHVDVDGEGDVDSGKANAKEPSPSIVINAKGEVLQLNSAALAAGIHNGMRLGTASVMAEHLHFVCLDEALEHKKLNELAAYCYALSSDIVLRYQHRCLLIEFSGMLKLHGDVASYLSTVQSALSALSLDVQYAVAPSALLAELLARYQPVLSEPCLAPGQASQALKTLPVACLDVSKKMVKQLERLGLVRIADVQALPHAELAMRLGVECVDYLKQLSPTAQPILKRFKPPEHFSLTVSFEAEVQTTSALMFPIKRLLYSLERFLHQSSQTIQSVECLLCTRAQHIQRIKVFSAHPEISAQHWHNLLRLRLDNLELSAPVLGLELCAEQFLELTSEATDLFDSSVSARSIASTLSRLEARLGQGCLQSPSLRNTHVPEQSFEYQRVADIRALNKHWQVSEPLRDYAKNILRPTLLFEQPEALSETVRVVHGPERIQAGWWQEVPIERDYFVAVNEHQQLLWVFRDPEQYWFVHGLFA